MHAKVIVVDGSESIVSTGNFAQTLLARERNYVVRDKDPSDVAVLAKLFEADFSRSAPDLTCTRLLVSPVNSKDRLLALIKSAGKTIEVESMQLADTSVRNALAERKGAGVDVRVLLADPSWITANTDAAAFLATQKIPAKRLQSPNVHVKSIIVDGQKAYAGSVNLSATSLTKNREVGLILEEPKNVQTMLSTFESDWTAAQEFAPTP
jgi:phosphatidylserine/phosphatidylglycerophosphate/cardiolipin synthase-like enzyme